MEIRKAAMVELEHILALYARARGFMREKGNPTQWGSTYPPRETVVNDIETERCYVAEQDGEIAGVFFYDYGKDAEPNYNVIDGAWLNDAPYGVMHRVISTGKVPGVVRFCSDWCLARHGNVRIDTHIDNLPMQEALKRCGFTYCGIVVVEDGTERLAYQKLQA